jgi:hypothetical protein
MHLYYPINVTSYSTKLISRKVGKKCISKSECIQIHISRKYSITKYSGVWKGLSCPSYHCSVFHSVIKNSTVSLKGAVFSHNSTSFLWWKTQCATKMSQFPTNCSHWPEPGSISLTPPMGLSDQLSCNLHT